VAGPLLASAFLYFYPDHYRTLFALTIIPGAIAVALIFFVDEPGVSDGMSGSSRTVDEPLPRELTSFLCVLTLFTLGNSTDAFLLLKLTDVAGSPKFIPAMWSALHVVKAIVSIVGGSWSDRIGRRRVIAIGWLVYALVYGGFAVSESLPAQLAWFLIYGFYFGLTEGTEKALIADLAPASRRGYAFGVYTAVQGLGALAASVVFGLIWNRYGSAAAFAVGAGLALLATALLFVVVRPSRG
jgi:MFS family permease